MYGPRTRSTRQSTSRVRRPAECQRASRAEPAESRYGPVDDSSIQQVTDDGSSTYRGLLLSTQRRFARGFSLQGNYTISRCMTDRANLEPGIAGAPYTIPGNRAADYGHCPFSPEHNVNLSVVYQIPTVSSSGVVSALTGGWQVSGILSAASGSYLTVTTGVDNALTGQPNQRANQVLDDPFMPNRSVTQWLNPAAFKAPAPGDYGTMPIDAFRGPGRWNVDMNLTRSLPLAGQQLQLRLEVFNVLNHINLSNPVTSLSSSNFGQITSIASLPRIVQLAVKYILLNTSGAEGRARSSALSSNVSQRERIARARRRNAANICPWRNWRSGRSDLAERTRGRPQSDRVEDRMQTCEKRGRESFWELSQKDSRPLFSPPRYRPVQRHADEGDDLRFPASNLASQRALAVDVLVRHQRVDARRRPRYQVRDAESPFRQTPVVFGTNRFRHQARIEEQLPEPVRVAREVMTDRRRSDARIDSDEQHTHGRANAIAKHSSRCDALVKSEPRSSPVLFRRGRRRERLALFNQVGCDDTGGRRPAVGGIVHGAGRNQKRLAGMKGDSRLAILL